jgi:hypothetical protein
MGAQGASRSTVIWESANMYILSSVSDAPIWAATDCIQLLRVEGVGFRV